LTNNIADMSLTSGHPENVQRRGAVHVQQGLKERVSIMITIAAHADNGLRHQPKTILIQRLQDLVHH
jgi:hypothetical protein